MQSFSGMRSTFTLLGLALPLLLAGCQKSETPVPAASTPASAAAASGSAATVRGIYVWGPEVETFSPCNTDKTYWLNGDATLLQPLQELAMEKADTNNEAYQPIYLEAEIADAGTATEGDAMDYDGLRELRRVIASSKQVPEDCKLIDPPNPEGEGANSAASQAASS